MLSEAPLHISNVALVDPTDRYAIYEYNKGHLKRRRMAQISK